MESMTLFQFLTHDNSSVAPTTVAGPEEAAESILSKGLFTAAASLSVVGSLTIFLTFFMWPDLRTTSRRMIVFISIGDFLVASSNIIGLYMHSNEEMCEIQATINIAAILASFFWTVYLSVYFYLTICKTISVKTEKVAMWLFHITAWGIPLAIAIIAYLDDAVGSSKDYVSPGWCWIKYTHGHLRWKKMVLWMCIAGKGWEILAYIAITVFYVLVKLQIRRELKMGFIPGCHFLTLKSVEVAKKADHKLTFIPVVFILLRIWGTVRFIRLLADYPEDPSVQVWLVMLQGIGDNSQGFANFVLFCLFTDKIRNKFRLCCSRFIPCCRLSPEKDPLFGSTNLFYGTIE